MTLTSSSHIPHTTWVSVTHTHPYKRTLPPPHTHTRAPPPPPRHTRARALGRMLGVFRYVSLHVCVSVCVSVCVTGGLAAPLYELLVSKGRLLSKTNGFCRVRVSAHVCVSVSTAAQSCVDVNC